MNEPEAIVFVVDDDASVRRSLLRLLRSAEQQAEAYASSAEFLGREHHDGPGCLVLDLQMPSMDGLELQEKLAAAAYSLPIVFITGHGDVPSTVRAMKAGAVDFLSKPFSAEDLLGAVSQALDQSRRERQHRAEIATIQQRVATLTPREAEVLRYVIAGAPNKQIAAALGTVEKTIKVHRARVMEKTRAGSVAELVRLAERVDITPLPAGESVRAG